jgi:DNA-binding transcriptional regulator LsrR (DeoR family)
LFRIRLSASEEEKTMARTATRQKKTKFQSDQDELKLRAAWLYFIEGLTQEQVAQHLGISRIKALRLLAATREDGTVQISINAQAEPLLKLQRALERHFGLFEAIVAPAQDQSEASIAAVVGHATGRYISERVSGGLTIGVGWGATLAACMNSLSSRGREHDGGVAAWRPHPCCRPQSLGRGMAACGVLQDGTVPDHRSDLRAA